MKCPKCERMWDDDSEQAACIRVFSECIVCRLPKELSGEIESIGLDEILQERKVYFEALTYSVTQSKKV